MTLSKSDRHAEKAKKKVSKYLPEITVFAEEFKKLSAQNPLFVFSLPQSKTGGIK